MAIELLQYRSLLLEIFRNTLKKLAALNIGDSQVPTSMTNHEDSKAVLIMSKEPGIIVPHFSDDKLLNRSLTTSLSAFFGLSDISSSR